MTALCVTGMHRSGTSLVAEWLHACGLVLDTGGILGSRAGNERGHFEDVDFLRLHAETMMNQVPGSRGWIVNDARCAQALHLDLRRAQALAAQRDARYRAWGWKDPRTVFFLRDWMSVIDRLVVLLVWRPCDQVVASLDRRRNSSSIREFQISRDEAIGLWKISNTLALQHCRAAPERTLLVDVRSLLARDFSVLAWVNSRLGGVLSWRPVTESFDPDRFSLKPARSGTSDDMEVGEITRELTGLSVASRISPGEPDAVAMHGQGR